AFYVNGSRAVAFGNTSWGIGKYRFVNLSLKEYPPTFDHNLTNQFLNESDTLMYDINCSDLNPEDNITYYDNSTTFDINSTSGLIYWTPVDNETGNYTILISCSDGNSNVTGTFNITVYDINNAPVLDSIGPLIATEGTLFTFDVNATDADGDNLTYSTNTSLFTINETTGIFSFTPTLAQVGNYSINFSVSDGVLEDYEIVSFRIVRGPYCGDGTCGGDETCSNCAADCGACASVPGAGVGEAAGAGAGAGAVGRRTYATCVERWECSDWSVCSTDGMQMRRCLDVNGCGTKKKKPTELQECTYIPTCSDGIQNQNEIGVDCGGPCPACPIPASCSDGIQNQNEEGIDCGGSCESCVVKKFVKIPIPKLAPLAKTIPWLLLIILAIIISSMTLGDRLYVSRIRKGEFEEFRRKIRRYRRIQRNVYITSAVLSVIGIAYTLYIYMLSDNPAVMDRFMWLPITSIIAILSIVFFVMRHFKYYEYKKKKKETLFELEHKRMNEELIKMEDDILISLESKITKRISLLWEKNTFKEKEMSSKVKEIFGVLRELGKERKDKSKPIETNEGIKASIFKLSASLDLEDLSKEYPEFKDILDTLIMIKEDKYGEDRSKKIERFILSVINVARDRHLQTVVRSSKNTIDLYNEIIDVYEYYNEQFNSKEEVEGDLVKKESSISKYVDEITNKEEMLDKIKENAKYASLYNSLVDIYNHYKRRQDIREQMREMGRV
ncbi:MAG: putative Ig domain-containing protein, partial [Nanoarchaeota archaeon]|nr:putative Ig domain-containing protein [Nanoarchaeota archaeon]